ncbi:MAG: hypothetical protein QN187_00445 [Armatimonadota bacterium]|nr:hypothetical protein [Armatimonadota bacterium]MDR7518774.1 hypothetical protein [Armatimonadota bacterium]MDR7549619.1 hypothetical protein [Armatimonadota bacterium]
MKKTNPAQADLLVRLMELADAPHNLEAMQYVVFQFDFKDYEQFIIECPPGSIRFNNVLRVAVFCDNLGYLVETEAVDREAIYELFPIPWAKVEPIIYGMRRELDWPDAFDYFERLGRDYMKWWEAKRKRIKPLPPLPQTSSTPRALTVARTRAPLPVRPPVPPRPATSPAAAPAARAASPAAPAAAKPPLRVLAKPPLKLAGKPAKVLKDRAGSRPAAKGKPKSQARPTSGARAGPKARAKSSRRR